MKLNIEDIHHEYIKRIVIFSLFAFKNQIRNPNKYNQYIQGFLKKRLPWKINLIIETGPRLDKNEEREIMLDVLLNDSESDYMRLITVTFTTPKKTTKIEVDLKDVEKYEKYLYEKQ